MEPSLAVLESLQNHHDVYVFQGIRQNVPRLQRLSRNRSNFLHTIADLESHKKSVNICAQTLPVFIHNNTRPQILAKYSDYTLDLSLVDCKYFKQIDNFLRIAKQHEFFGSRNLEFYAIGFVPY